MICVSAGSKSRLAKAAGAEVAAQSRQEKLHAAVARSTFQVKMCKTPRLRSTFGSSDVQKWHAAVARSVSVKLHPLGSIKAGHQHMSCL